VLALINSPVGSVPPYNPGRFKAGKQSRRVNGHVHLRSLRDTLDQVTQPVGAPGHTQPVDAA